MISFVSLITILFLFNISIEYYLIDFNWSSLFRASEFILKEPRYWKGFYIILAITVLFYLIPYGDFWFGDLTLGEFFCVNIFQEKPYSDAVAVCSWHFSGLWCLWSWPKFFYYNARIVKCIFFIHIVICSWTCTAFYHLLISVMKIEKLVITIQETVTFPLPL